MLRCAITFFVSLMLGLSLANAQPGGQRQAKVDFVSERDIAQPGETFFVAFDFEIKPKWHVYWRNAGDSGLPAEIFWSEGLGEEAGDFIWAAPHEIVVLEDQIMNYGFSDRLVLPFSLTVPATAAVGDVVRLAGTLEYQICDDVCIIEREEFDVSVAVGEAPRINETDGALIAQWIGKAPTEFEGETSFVGQNEDTSWTLHLAAPELAQAADHIRFFPYEHDIKHAASQPVSHGPNGATLTLTPGYLPELGKKVDGVVVVERDGAPTLAYEISAPVGANKLAGTSGSSGQNALKGGTSKAGLNLFAIAGLALLGGLILNLMPCVLPVLSIKAVGMVHAVTSGDSAHMRAHGIWYTIGVLVSFLAVAGIFIALRSAGHLVSFGFQLQYPAVVAALVLIMFLIGLWLLGVFEVGTSIQGVGSGLAAKQGNTGAFFTGVLAAIVGAPCVGPFLAVAAGAVVSAPAPIVIFVFFLIGLGMALPFLAISFMPNLQRFLPKPGAWMERLKQFFAFPMFLTAAWLLSVLGEQAGTRAVMWAVVGATLLGFGIWALSNSGGRLKLAATAFGAAMLLGGVALPINASLNGAPPALGEPVSYAGDYQSEAWSTARVDEVLGEGRGIFVDFTATWCATCQVNKLTTLKKTAVQKAFADNNITFMVADYTNRDDAITAEIQKHNRPGVPMYLYYAPGSRTPKVLPQVLSVGFIKDLIASSEG